MSNRLFIMAGLSFLSMYILMYMMVDTPSNIYINLDQLYMVIAMTSAMLLIEIFVMGSMYGKKLKISVTILSVAALIFSFVFVRNQTAISDREFLKSMISHHGAAILMCNEAKIEDREVQELCKDILSSQQSQIDWMKTRLSNI